MSDINMATYLNWRGHGKDTNKDTDTEADMETDMDKDKDKDTDTDMELHYFWLISIQRYSRFSAIWITCETS